MGRCGLAEMALKTNTIEMSKKLVCSIMLAVMFLSTYSCETDTLPANPGGNQGTEQPETPSGGDKGETEDGGDEGSGTGGDTGSGGEPETPPYQGLTGRYTIRDKKFYVDGEEFFIQGACINGFQGMVYYETAVSAGLNSLRPYDAGGFGGDSNIDYLGSNGIYANLGIRINGLTMTNFDAKFTEITNSLKPYLNNENILLWTIGNELEHVNAYGHGRNDYEDLGNAWNMVEKLSQWIHANDPHKRPTTTALIGHYNVGKILRRCPSLDIISINYYYPGPGNVQAMMETFPEWVASDKPYIVSEYNLSLSSDEWDMYTSWRPAGALNKGGIIEPNSTQKCAEYKKIYNEYIQSNKGKGCIGSYIFLWGWQTHGDLPTWHAMFDQFSNYPFSTVDALAECFGKEITNRAPVIEGGYSALQLNGRIVTDNVSVDRGAACSATITASDPEGDRLSYRWVIVKDERMEWNNNGPQGLKALQNHTTGEAGVTFNAPSAAGNYRLLAYVYDDGHKKAAMASFPFQVK